MKKILCAMLGLLFSISANAACNLFNLTATDFNNGTVLGDAKQVTLTLKPNTKYTLSSNESGGSFQNANIWFNGNSSSIDSVFLNQPRTTRTDSSGKLFIAIRSGKIDQILRDFWFQLEEGSTATAYTPYNPLCATCDGTIVNYTSATGTGVQNGTPTPTNPIDPVFYTQGDMVLRKVGDYADSYDATTGKITRRVGVKVFDGTEDFDVYAYGDYAANPYFSTVVENLVRGGTTSTKIFCNMLTSGNISNGTQRLVQYTGDGFGFFIQPSNGMLTAENFKSWLAQQYAAGTPMTMWYPLATEVVEDWPASQCQQNIRVATTKYVETQFSGLSASLAAAVATVNTVVTNTITQAASIATLQSGKQTRPADDTCPAGKKCLLVEGTDGKPHWYEICSSAHCLPDGYTELKYIQSTGVQEIDTGLPLLGTDTVKLKYSHFIRAANESRMLFGNYFSTYRFAVNFYSSGTTNGLFYWGNENQVGFKTPPTNDDLSHVVKFENAKIYIDNDIVVSSHLLTSNFDTGGNMFIFSAGASSFKSAYRLYYYQHAKADGQMVRDLVPAKRNSDDAVGLYDLVDKQFYTNTGFIDGPVAE